MKERTRHVRPVTKQSLLFPARDFYLSKADYIFTVTFAMEVAVKVIHHTIILSVIILD